MDRPAILLNGKIMWVSEEQAADSQDSFPEGISPFGHWFLGEFFAENYGDPNTLVTWN